jgi:hypothetical protein
MVAASAAEQAGPGKGRSSAGPTRRAARRPASPGAELLAGSWLEITEHSDFRAAEPAA